MEGKCGCKGKCFCAPTLGKTSIDPPRQGSVKTPPATIGTSAK